MKPGKPAEDIAGAIAVRRSRLATRAAYGALLLRIAALLAAGTAFCPDGRKHPGLWAALALLLAGLYMLLTFTPPGWGPFINPLG